MIATGSDWALTVEPRRWQLRALDLWTPSMRGIAEVVTGAGKTVFAEMCMLRFHERFPNGRVVILVPTLALMDQWYVSLREDLRVPDTDIATYSGEGRPGNASLVNLMVLNTARDAAPPLAAGSATFLIADECHRAASPVNARSIAGPHEATLGLSATPKRDYDLGLEDVLIPALGEILVRYDYNEALKDGVISPFELINVAIPLTTKERAEYDKQSKRVAILIRRVRDGDDVQDTLRRALRTRASISANAALRIPAALRLADDTRGARTIVFHERIRAAEQIKQLLEARRFSATIYHSRIGPVMRRDNLRLFRRGMFDILVTCRALDEGTNVPETSVAVIASSTASTRQRIQRLGRVLRPAPGKKRATIYTIYATEVERERLAREAVNLTEAESVTWQRATVKIDA
jgi:superfamily II DNA or RNA helicase